MHFDIILLLHNPNMEKCMATVRTACSFFCARILSAYGKNENQKKICICVFDVMQPQV